MRRDAWTNRHQLLVPCYPDWAESDTMACSYTCIYGLCVCIYIQNDVTMRLFLGFYISMLISSLHSENAFRHCCHFAMFECSNSAIVELIHSDTVSIGYVMCDRTWWEVVIEDIQPLYLYLYITVGDANVTPSIEQSSMHVHTWPILTSQPDFSYQRFW